MENMVVNWRHGRKMEFDRRFLCSTDCLAVPTIDMVGFSPSRMLNIQPIFPAIVIVQKNEKTLAALRYSVLRRVPSSPAVPGDCISQRPQRLARMIFCAHRTIAIVLAVDFVH